MGKIADTPYGNEVAVPLQDPTNVASTTGVNIDDSSADGIFITEEGTGPIFVASTDGGGVSVVVHGGAILLSGQGGQGTLEIGDGAATPIGFYGAPPVVQAAAIPAPSGGTTVDTEARAAIDAILTVLGASAGVGLTA